MFRDHLLIERKKKKRLRDVRKTAFLFVYLPTFDAFGPRAAALTQVEHERVGTAVGVGHLEPHVRVADRDQGASIGRPRYALYRPGRLAGVRHDRDRPERRGQRPHLLTARIGEVRLVHVYRIVLVDQMLGQLRTVVYGSVYLYR